MAMPIIHVRNIPEELAAQLQARAKEHRRSMEAEVRMILAEAMLPRPLHQGPRHVNFDLIATVDLGEWVVEPMDPELGEVEL